MSVGAEYSITVGRDFAASAVSSQTYVSAVRAHQRTPALFELIEPKRASKHAIFTLQAHAPLFVRYDQANKHSRDAAANSRAKKCALARLTIPISTFANAITMQKI